MREPVVQNLRIVRKWGENAEMAGNFVADMCLAIRIPRHEPIPGRAGRRVLCGNPQAPAIETNAAR